MLIVVSGETDRVCCRIKVATIVVLECSVFLVDCYVMDYDRYCLRSFVAC